MTRLPNGLPAAEWRPFTSPKELFRPAAPEESNFKLRVFAELACTYSLIPQWTDNSESGL